LFPWQSLLVAAQELNINITTAAVAMHKKNFFILLLKSWVLPVMAGNTGQELIKGNSRGIGG
jgi:hypothetical protein